MQNSISRRAALATIAGTSAVAALPVAAAATIPAERSAWDRAFAAYKAASAEDQAFNAVFDRLYARCKAAEEAIPHNVLRPDPYTGQATPVSTADRMFVQHARSWVEKITAGTMKLDPLSSLQEHYQLCQEVAAAADERDAKVEAVRARFGMDDAEEKWEALGQRAYEAEWALMEIPAPDAPALLFKLEKLLEVERDGSTAPWAERAVRQTIADARRLLAREA
ncbi:MAG: hypothetical protein M3Q08_01665 [Pseudomonadota bacterium]|nr:hypothetical protein [Pseudomonadota bacterium]